MKSPKHVASLSFALRHPDAMCRGLCVPAREGMRVQKGPCFPSGKEAGRVGRGVGIVHSADAGLENLVVSWPADGDFTIWTRAGKHGFDVVTA